MTTRFAEKLNRLSETVAMFSGFDSAEMKKAIIAGRDRHAIAVGSGGSVISAEFFARCRETLSHGTTSIQTPMHLVLGLSDVSDSDVWLFSAGANNPYTIAAVRLAGPRPVRRTEARRMGKEWV